MTYTDTQRLDYLASSGAMIVVEWTTSFWLEWPRDNERQDGDYPTARDAIDAQLDKEKTK